MQLGQKRGRLRTSFDFGENELIYTFGNAGMKVGGSIPYHKIPGRANTREIRVWWFRYVTVSYLVFSAIMAFGAAGENNLNLLITALYAATVLFFIICFFAFSRRQVGMTTIALNPALIVLHDGRRQAIFGEIMKRRAQAMRAKQAQIDFNRPYYEEAGKFSWLREEGIITEEEYHQARQKIDAMRNRAAFTSPGSGNLN